MKRIRIIIVVFMIFMSATLICAQNEDEIWAVAKEFIFSKQVLQRMEDELNTSDGLCWGEMNSIIGVGISKTRWSSIFLYGTGKNKASNCLNTNKELKNAFVHIRQIVLQSDRYNPNDLQSAFYYELMSDIPIKWIEAPESSNNYENIISILKALCIHINESQPNDQWNELYNVSNIPMPIIEETVRLNALQKLLAVAKYAKEVENCTNSDDCFGKVVDRINNMVVQHYIALNSRDIYKIMAEISKQGLKSDVYYRHIYALVSFLGTGTYDSQFVLKGKNKTPPDWYVKYGFCDF